MANQTEATTASFLPTVDGSTEPAIAESERIKNLRNSKVKLSKIQEELEKLIDAMAQNPSILSRVSNFWGKIPLWQKIIAGIILIAPPLVLGFFIHAIVCFVISAFALASYVSSSVVLDDHYTHTQYSTKNIKTGVTSLAEGLDVIMDSLEQISQALAEQVDLFAEENKKFGENVTTLKTRNEELIQEVEKLKHIEKKLRLSQRELEATCTALKASVQEQTSLLEETQTALNQITIDYAQNQRQLEDKTKELEQINASLHSEVEKYKNAQHTLKAALEVMAETATKDQSQKEAFFGKLTDFIEKNDSSFLELSQTFRTEVAKLKETQKKYEEQIGEYAQLIARTDTQVKQLEQASLLTNHGFYAKSATQEVEINAAAPTYQ
jgi:ABC-type transporter Mla subunit MlaD